jgi:ATP-binding cassette subfamily F protein 3
MILNISNISKSFDGKEILNSVSFHIEDHEKVALVGMNGAGKSTLLKIVMGILSPDKGSAVLSSGAKIGYLAQHQDLTGTQTVYQQLLHVKKDLLELSDRIRESERRMSALSGSDLEEEMKSYARMTEAFERADGYAYKSEVVGVLKGLGFDEADFDKPIATLSGGQKTRVALGRLLLTSPDLILLDEPTNHLDMHSIEWLETYLLNYKGAVLIVSHDRYFLNKVVSKVVEIEHGRAHTYRGNYDAFSLKKEQLRRAAYAAYVKAEQERKHQETVITKLKQFNREKSIKRAESREKMLDKMDLPDKPEELQDKMKLTLKPRFESGNDVLHVEDLSKSFDGDLLFQGVGMDIKKGEHVALIGNNGTGKSTILKILNGVLPADSGLYRYGSNVTVGYYDQEMQVLNSSKTIFEEISDDYPDMNNTEIRTTLAAFLFTNEDVFKLIGDLSGGERARVSLCKLMLSNANFLILDEPTNHLDITSREILESAVRSYQGTVLYVSHDRYFINRTASRILDLTRQSLLSYIGNYDYYLDKRADLERAYFGEDAASDQPVREETDAKSDWKAQKEAEAKKRKRANALSRLEQEIDRLETRDGELDQALSDPEIGTDLARLTELTKEKDAIAGQLEEAYRKWEELQEES